MTKEEKIERLRLKMKSRILTLELYAHHFLSRTDDVDEISDICFYAALRREIVKGRLLDKIEDL